MEKEKGYLDYVPYYITEKDKIIPIYIIADAINPEAKPGAKTGNFVLDDLLEYLRKQEEIRNQKIKEKL